MSPYLGFRVFGLALILVLSTFHRIDLSTSHPSNPVPPIAGARRPFRMLVLGDSVMWGQGLKTEHKLSYQVRDWICAQRNNGTCANPDDVDIYVEAHSGAVIAKPDVKDQKEEERFTRSTFPVRFPGEVNNAYPTVWGQVDLARRYYTENLIPLEEVDLIIVNGGINDMGPTKILIPKPFERKITEDAKEFCGTAMEAVLKKIVRAFPNARIIVPGYFPLVSLKTPPKILLQTILAAIKGAKEENAEVADDGSNPRPNPLVKRLAARSTEWTVASNDALEKAVANLNSGESRLPIGNHPGAPPQASLRAQFVSVEFKPENAYGPKETFLWKLVGREPNTELECADKNILGKLIVGDELQVHERPCMCDQAGRRNNIVCLRAGAFHPNTEGAKAYFRAIKSKLERILPFVGWT